MSREEILEAAKRRAHQVLDGASTLSEARYILLCETQTGRLGAAAVDELAHEFLHVATTDTDWLKCC